MTTATARRSVLGETEWRATAAAHRDRADALTADHRSRAARAEKHPVEDFLFTYYSYRPSLLRKWHPGAGVVLDRADDRASWRWYMVDADGRVAVDAAAYLTDRGDLVRGIEALLRATAARRGSFGCFGMHEWAMVYRADDLRHVAPLRLGAAATDAVVESADLQCTHYDAFRFFTPDAAPRNATPLTRDGQTAREQPGCLHAGMDLYKWAVKLGPLVPGEVLLDAFELARDIRVLDMQASPYDLRAWGYEPVPVETAPGKSEYGRRQRAFSERAAGIRSRLIDACSLALSDDTR